jgi:hypothetical protein
MRRKQTGSLESKPEATPPKKKEKQEKEKEKEH